MHHQTKAISCIRPVLHTGITKQRLYMAYRYIKSTTWSNSCNKCQDKHRIQGCFSRGKCQHETYKQNTYILVALMTQYSFFAVSRCGGTMDGSSVNCDHLWSCHKYPFLSVMPPYHCMVYTCHWNQLLALQSSVIFIQMWKHDNDSCHRISDTPCTRMTALNHVGRHCRRLVHGLVLHLQRSLVVAYNSMLMVWCASAVSSSITALTCIIVSM